MVNPREYSLSLLEQNVYLAETEQNACICQVKSMLIWSRAAGNFLNFHLYVPPVIGNEQLVSSAIIINLLIFPFGSFFFISYVWDSVSE